MQRWNGQFREGVKPPLLKAPSNPRSLHYLWWTGLVRPPTEVGRVVFILFTQVGQCPTRSRMQRVERCPFERVSPSYTTSLSTGSYPGVSRCSVRDHSLPV